MRAKSLNSSQIVRAQMPYFCRPTVTFIVLFYSILFKLNSVQQWRYTATCAAALGLSNLYNTHRDWTNSRAKTKFNNEKQKKAKQGKIQALNHWSLNIISMHTIKIIITGQCDLRMFLHVPVYVNSEVWKSHWRCQPDVI